MRARFSFFPGALLVFLASDLALIAQITHETTTTFGQNTMVSATGGAYTISGTAMTIKGSNQFLSFGQFSLPNSTDSATFTNPAGATITNILARVTGGASNIQGTITSQVTGANLFLINPAGVMFGSGARVNVDGAFTATTANYVQLRDGTKFYADTAHDGVNGADTMLTTSPVESFGFMSANTGSISVTGLTSASTATGFQFIAGSGGVTVTNSTIAGTTQPVGVFAGTQTGGSDGLVPNLNLTAATGPVVIDYSNATHFLTTTETAPVTFTNSSVGTSVSSGAGSNVVIRGGVLQFLGGSAITSTNSGSGAGGSIIVDAVATTISGSAITSAATGQGAGNATATGGSIMFGNTLAGSVSLTSGAQILSYTSGSGTAGDVSVGSSSLSIAGSGTATAITSPVAINSSGLLTFNSVAPTGIFSAQTTNSGVGSAGAITLTSSGSTALSAGGQIGSISENDTGSPGAVGVTAGAAGPLSLATGGQIFTYAGGTQTGATLNIDSRASDAAGPIFSLSIDGTNGSGIFSLLGNGATAAGLINVDSAGTVSLTNGGAITSAGSAITVGKTSSVTNLALDSTSKIMDSGTGSEALTLNATGTVTDNGTISTAATGGIAINSASSVLLTAGKITDTGASGDITLGSSAVKAIGGLTLAQDSSNHASSISNTTGSGGISVITSGNVSLTGSSLAATSGTVSINSSAANLSNSVSLNTTTGATRVGSTISTGGNISLGGTTKIGSGGVMVDGKSKLMQSGSGTLTITTGGAASNSGQMSADSVSLTAGSLIDTGTITSAGSGGVTVDLTGTTGTVLSLSGAAGTGIFSQGNGPIMVTSAGKATLSGGEIDSTGGGTITVLANNGGANSLMITSGGIFSQDSGSVTVTSQGTLTLSTGTAGISSTTDGSVAGSSVTISAGALMLTGSGTEILTSTTGAGSPGQNAGNITINDPSLTPGSVNLAAGTRIISTTNGTGAAGDVTVNDSTLTITGGSALTVAASGVVTPVTGIFSESDTTGLGIAGSAGSISVNSSSDVSVTLGGQIGSLSTGPTDPGNISAAGGVTINVSSGAVLISGTGSGTTPQDTVPVIYSFAANPYATSGEVDLYAFGQNGNHTTVTISQNAAIETYTYDSGVAGLNNPALPSAQPGNVIVEADTLTIDGNAAVQSLVAPDVATGTFLTTANTGVVEVLASKSLTMGETASDTASIDTIANSELTGPGTGAAGPVTVEFGVDNSSNGALYVDGTQIGAPISSVTYPAVTFGTIHFPAETIATYNAPSGQFIFSANAPSMGGSTETPSVISITPFNTAFPFGPPPNPNDIYFDSSLGSAGTALSTSDNQFDITPSDGITIGDNLYLSFSSFSLSINTEIADFQIPANIQNILVRVTGGASTLNGKIEETPAGSITGLANANLYLFNPAGISFGSNGSGNTVVVGGSLTISTANQVTLAGSGTFSTSISAGDGLLTSSPGAFMGSVHQLGFSPNPAAISLSHSAITTGTNANFQVSGGPITITDSQVEAFDGGILIFSGGANGGTINNVPNLQTEADLGDTFGSGNHGLITITDSSIDTQAQDGQAIASTLLIRGDTVNLSNNTTVSAESQATMAPAGDLIVDMDTAISLASTSISVPTIIQTSNTALTANANPGGNSGGNIELDANTISITGPSSEVLSTAQPLVVYNRELGSYYQILYSSTNPPTSANNSGNIALNVGQSLDVNGGQISTTTYGAGAGGNININGLPGSASLPAITMEDGGQITSNSILLSSSQVTNASVPLFPFLTASQYTSFLTKYVFNQTGNAGNITVQASSLSIDGGGLTSFTGISSNAGDVQSLANVTNTLAGNDPTGMGGTVSVTITGNSGASGTTGDLSIINGGQISASSFTSGACGFVNVIQSGSNDGNAITINGNMGGTVQQMDGLPVTGILADCFGTGQVNAANPTDAALNATKPTPLAVSVTAAGTVALSAGGEISSATFGSDASNETYVSTNTVTNAQTTLQIGGGSLDLTITPDVVSASLTYPGSLSIDGSNALNVFAQGNLLSTGVISSTYGHANAGDLNVNVTGSVDIVSGGIISDGCINGAGAGGDLDAVISGDLTIDAMGATAFSDTSGFDFTPTGITTSSFFPTAMTGSAGNLTVDASGTVTIQHGAQISSGSIEGADGGTLNVTTGALTIDGSNTPILADSYILYPTGIISASFRGGNAGAVTVNASGPVTIENGGQISSETYYTYSFPLFSGLGGNGGDLTLNITPATPLAASVNALTIDGSGVQPDQSGGASSGDAEFVTGLLSSTVDGVMAGNVTVTVHSGSVSLRGGGQLSAESDGIGTGGLVTLTIQAGSLAINGSSSTSSSLPTLADQFYIDPSYIFDNAPVPLQTGVFSSTEGIANAGSAVVSASGDVSLTAGGLISSGTTDRAISIGGATYSGSGLGGDVTLTSGSLTIDGTASTALPTGILSTTNLPANTTAGSSEGDAGTLTLTVAGAVNLTAGGIISSNSTSNGGAGTVNLSAGSVTIDGVTATLPTGILTSSISEPSSATSSGGTINLSVPGAISIRNNGQIAATTATDQNGGDIYIGGESSNSTAQISPSSLSLSGAGQITAAALGPPASTGSAGNVEVTIAGDVTILSGSQISSGTTDQGAGGAVYLSANSLRIDGMTSAISSSSSSTGAMAGTGGDVNLSISGSISLTDGGEISATTKGGDGDTGGYGGNIFIGVASTSSDPNLTPSQLDLTTPISLTIAGSGTEIISDTSGAGNAGTIDAAVAGLVAITDGGQLSSNTTSSGAAGSITLGADSLAMSGPTSAISTSSTGTSGPTATGDTGTIILTVPGSISLSTGAQIAATTTTGQAGGDITISQLATPQTPSGNMTLSDAQTAITAAATGAGDSGSINVITDGTLTVDHHATINCSSQIANAGPQQTMLNMNPQAITISAAQLILTDSGSIDATAPSTVAGVGNGGSLTIKVGQLIYLSNSDILTFAGDQGGNITIDPEFVILGNSLISAHGLVDGNISIDTNYLLKSESTIQATGTISINTVPLDLGGSLIGLPGELTDEEKRLRESCARAANHEFSSLIVVGRGGTESAPEELQPDFGADALPQLSTPGTKSAQ